MNVRQLKAFHAVMEAGSITDAAEVLHISQPAVSKMIQAFEADMGLALFTRTRRRLVPTIEAIRLHQEVDTLFLHLSRIRHMANEIRSLGTGQLRVGALPLLGNHLLPQVLSEFSLTHPGLEILLSVASSQKVVEMVLAQQVDIGLFATPASMLAPSSMFFCSLPGVVVLPEKHPLMTRDTLVPKDLEDCRFVSLGREDKMRRLIDALFTIHEVHRLVLVETQIADCVCQFVANGLGVAIVDPITAHYNCDRVAVKRIEPTVHFDISMARPISLPDSALVTAFLELFKSHIVRFSGDS